MFAALLLVLGLSSSDSGEIRLEHFVLETSGGSDRTEVGLVSLRRRAIEGGRQLECEWLFRRKGEPGEDEHVLHVERDAGPGPALVWREWGALRSRCLTAERTADETGLLLVETSRGGIPRETIPAVKVVAFPLELVERARAGTLADGRCARFEPLARAIEPLEVRTTTTGDVRVVELAREDKSSAGRFEFRGSELVGFQWQDGGLEARRVTEEEYARRLAAGAPLARRP
jgi:hypothetical protein